VTNCHMAFSHSHQMTQHARLTVTCVIIVPLTAPSGAVFICAECPKVAGRSSARANPCMVSTGHVGSIHLLSWEAIYCTGFLPVHLLNARQSPGLSKDVQLGHGDRDTKTVH
jgi:hypothetical protein